MSFNRIVRRLINYLLWSGLTLLFCLGVMVAPAQADEKPIDIWSIWGPAWGRGGLAASSPNYEKYLNPQPGDTDFSAGNDHIYLYSWKLAESSDGFLPLFSLLQSEIASSWDRWAGGCIYAHTYLYSPVPTHVELRVQSSPPVERWFNGEKLTHNFLNLQRGWNHVLLKIQSPTDISKQSPRNMSEKDWWFRASLDSADRRSLKNIRVSPYEPGRKTPLIGNRTPLPLRYLSHLSDYRHQFPIFVEGQTVSLNYDLQAGYGFLHSDPESGFSPIQVNAFSGQPWVYSSVSQDLDNRFIVQYQQSEWAKSLPTSIHFKVFDDQDRVLLDEVRKMPFLTSKMRSQQENDFAANTRIALGKLPVGHYTVRSDFLNRDGTIQAHDRNHEFAVIWGPIIPKLDDSRRLLSCVHPWLIENIEQALLHFQWLHTLGITRQQKLSLAWRSWGARLLLNEKVVVKPAPNLDLVLKEAQKFGITVIGNLEMGWLDLERYKSLSPSQEGGVDNNSQPQIKKTPVDHANLLSLREPGGSRLPPYKTKAFEKVLQDYTVQLVSRYKDRIHMWTGSNEIDLKIASRTTDIARMYADATRILYRSLKKADSKAIFVSPSLAIQSEFTDILFKEGFGDNVDILDVHDHPTQAPKLSAPTLGIGRGGLAIVESYRQSKNSRKPVWYGETSAPLAHSPDGVWGQAEAVVKQLAWAIKNPSVQSLSYLVMNNQPSHVDTALGFNNRYGDPHPVVNSINVASHLLDGRRKLPDLKTLPKDVEHLRVSAKDERETLVLWSERETPIRLKVRDPQVVQVSLLGRRSIISAEGKTISININSVPQYLIGKFLE
jgi:hypothetical protein